MSEEGYGFGFVADSNPPTKTEYFRAYEQRRIMINLLIEIKKLLEDIKWQVPVKSKV